MTSTAIVHLGTGELIDGELADYPPEVLAEAALLLRERQADLRRMQRELEAELGARLEQREQPRKVWVVGDYSVKSKNRREWDADELEGVLRDLIDRGLISARDAQGVLKHEVTVSGSAALRLLERLEGLPGHTALARCFTWRQAGLELTRELPLLPRD
jgi:hypothetical protein